MYMGEDIKYCLIKLSSLIRTLPSAQESHLFGSFEFAGFHRRYGISPFPKDLFFIGNQHREYYYSRC